MTKKICNTLTLAMLTCLLTACGSTPASNEPVSSGAVETPQSADGTSQSAESSSKGEEESAQSTQSEEETSQSEEEPTQSEEETSQDTVQTDTLYVVYSDYDVEEYFIEYTGDKKNAEELAQELSNLTGLDFIITASETDDGLIIDWASESTLIAGPDGREQKEEFTFNNVNTLSWFMMDSLWCTLMGNLGTENIYYTMEGGHELFIPDLYPGSKFSYDVPYMGSGYYFKQGEELEAYIRTSGLWRLEGLTDTASIMMNGAGGFAIYYADGSVEAEGYLEYMGEDENGDYVYDCYTTEDDYLLSFSINSDNQLCIGEVIYLRDRFMDFQGYWMYSNGWILGINGDEWTLYDTDGTTLLDWGPTDYSNNEVSLMNEDGSSGGGRVFFDEDNNLTDGFDVLTFYGMTLVY